MSRTTKFILETVLQTLKISAFVLGFLILFAFNANAAGTSATVSWVAPTSYVDGTVMPASDIASYTIEWRRVAGGPLVGSQVVAAPALTAVVNVPCGGYVFDVTVTTGAGAVVPNVTSGPSNSVAYATGVVCSPNPPGAVTVK